MTRVAFTLFVFVVFTGFVVRAGDEAALKKETAALQGVWKVVDAETTDGKNAGLMDATLEFDKAVKSMTLTTKNGAAKKGTVTLSPLAKLKEINITPEGENREFEAIYQIEKTTLKICVSPDPLEGRPTEFAAKDGKKYILLTLEKAK
ncbi:MAG: TIGR03067 domain-containing protein [Gemmataceae bacterium]|nr:TIGR03067 domain-containing protein [Gemmataceae bacterium]